MSLKVFEREPFTEHPEKDGIVIVVAKKGTISADVHPYWEVGYTKKYGWNSSTYEDEDGLHAISDENMKSGWDCWLKPYTIGKRNWYETIETMLDEVRQELATYSDRELTEKEDEEYGNLGELYDYLDTARDFAEVLK